MFNFILIFLCLLLGIILQNIRKFPVESTYKILNKIVITACLPAIVLYYIPKLTWSNELLYPIGAAWISFVIAFALFYFLGRKYGWSNKLIGCLVLTAGLGNTSFLGYPIISALYGEQGLKMAILVDQPGTVVVLSTLGILVATYFSKENLRPFQMLVRVFKFPPFVFFLIARAFKSNLSFEELWDILLKMKDINAYPLKNFIGNDYNGFIFKSTSVFFNNKLLLCLSMNSFKIIKKII